MAENIKLISGQQQNFTVNQGYFYLFDYAQDNIIVKTDDGNTAFSYPLDTLLSTSQVVSTEFDGVYFWSLQNQVPGANDINIMRWKLDNFIAKLQSTFTYENDGSHNYNSNAFSVEHYHDSFAANASASGVNILLTTYSGSSLLNFTTTSGNGLTLHLGPNTNGEEEDVTVTGTIAGGVTVSSGLQYDYQLGDDINFYTNLWVFNNYDGLNATGALYKFDAYTGDYITRYSSGAYNGVGSATFFKVDSFADYGNVDALIYIKSTNMLFINVAAAGATLPYYGSMVLENIYDDESTVISVVDIAIEGDNVYRLQKREDGESGDWGQYNYDLSSLTSFISSISLSANPALLAANGISTANIDAYVKDQFLQPIVNKNVDFSIITNPGGDGTITGGDVDPDTDKTDSDGKAGVIYTSGTSAGEVQIRATAAQS
jgi:hypothetical protein